MIFVTVGSQIPFDRMIAAVDQWAGRTGRSDVFAQVGPTQLKTPHLKTCEFISPAECRQKMTQASLIVGHAGMGTILSALELGKPLLIMPRRGALKETRNDHQYATAVRFAELGRIAVALDEHELQKRLDEVDKIGGGAPISLYASERLLTAIRSLIIGS